MTIGTLVSLFIIPLLYWFIYRNKVKICRNIEQCEFSEKIEKGKTISEIADELEDTEENIARLIEEFHLRIN